MVSAATQTLRSGLSYSRHTLQDRAIMCSYKEKVIRSESLRVVKVEDEVDRTGARPREGVTAKLTHLGHKLQRFPDRISNLEVPTISSVTKESSFLSIFHQFFVIALLPLLVIVVIRWNRHTEPSPQQREERKPGDSRHSKVLGSDTQSSIQEISSTRGAAHTPTVKNFIMSKSSKKAADEKAIAQFSIVTGASSRDGKKYLDKYKRLDVAIDAYFTDHNQFGNSSSTPKRNDYEKKLTALFDQYKDTEQDIISIDGTIRLCEDLSVDPEDVVLLAVAYELKSPGVGQWSKKGWLDGWKGLGCDSLESMKAILPKLSQKLSSDPRYFSQVYSYTFDFARSEGQRSLALETAQAFWGLLLPQGLKGNALAHVASIDDDDDMGMEDEEGWQSEYTQWWFDFLNEKGGKGVSKDTWIMFLEFIRTIDSKFQKYDETAAWPSTIDDFVAWAKERLASSA